ncbi:MAG: cobalt-factor II C(20)-methyltransferase [Bacillota bacterium]|nr:cobalt-factor II C(20)-methyltransferase [Bacillota bacterium]
MGKLFGVGVGPGDKELLTLKAVKTIKNCQVIVAPSAMKGGKSIALEIAEEYIGENTEVMIKHFPMGGEEQDDKIYEAFQSIKDKLDKGLDVAFLTIGDPFIYSTYIYLLRHLREEGYETETVPGITSFCACASIAGEPLVIGDEPLLILPGTKINEIRNEKYIVIMKVYKMEEEIINYLEEKGFKYVYIARAGREGEKILTNKEDILQCREYMSMIIANRV